MSAAAIHLPRSSAPAEASESAVMGKPDSVKHNRSHRQEPPKQKLPQVGWVHGVPSDSPVQSNTQVAAASAGVGATMEVTKGKRTVSPPTKPNFRTNSRRAKRAPSGGGLSRSSNKWALPSRSSANHTNFSSILPGLPGGAFNSFCKRVAISLALVRPSQCFQTRAAVGFRQWARPGDSRAGRLRAPGQYRGSTTRATGRGLMP